SRWLVGITNPETAAEIQVTQHDSRRLELSHVTRDSLECAAERIERDNLRADVCADSMPANRARILVLQIQAFGAGPVGPEFMMIASRCYVRMAAGLHIRVHANRAGWRMVAAPNASCRFL